MVNVAASGEPHIVVVDDDELVLELVKRHLRGASCRLDCFLNENSAMDFLSSHHPSVLVMDQRLPTRDGIDLLQELNDAGRLERVQVFLCSAAALPDETETMARAMGVQPIIKDALSQRDVFLEMVARC